MKRLILLLILAVGLQAGEMENIFTKSQISRLDKAALQCSKNNDDIAVESARLLGLAISFGFGTDDMDMETVEQVISQFSSLRKKFISKCGHYNNGIIKYAYDQVKGNAEVTYELTGYIAGVGAMAGFVE